MIQRFLPDLTPTWWTDVGTKRTHVCLKVAQFFACQQFRHNVVNFFIKKYSCLFNFSLEIYTIYLWNICSTLNGTTCSANLWKQEIESQFQEDGNATGIKVVLMLQKVVWTDPWVFTVITTQGSAHATLRSTRKTLMGIILLKDWEVSLFFVK